MGVDVVYLYCGRGIQGDCALREGGGLTETDLNDEEEMAERSGKKKLLKKFEKFQKKHLLFSVGCVIILNVSRGVAQLG